MINQRIKRIEKATGINQPKKNWQETTIIPVTQECKDYWHAKGLSVPILGGLSKGLEDNTCITPEYKKELLRFYNDMQTS